MRFAGAIVLAGCCLLWVVVCCENSLAIDFVDAIAVAALIMSCVVSWQGDLSVSLSLRCLCACCLLWALAFTCVYY